MAAGSGLEESTVPGESSEWSRQKVSFAVENGFDEDAGSRSRSRSRSRSDGGSDGGSDDGGYLMYSEDSGGSTGTGALERGGGGRGGGAVSALPMYDALPDDAASVFGVPELCLLIMGMLDDADLGPLAATCTLFNAMLDDPLFWLARFRRRWRRARPHRVRRQAARDAVSIRSLFRAEVVRERTLCAALDLQWFDPVAQLCYEATPVARARYDVRYMTLHEARSGLAASAAPRVHWRHRRRRSSVSGDDSADSVDSSFSRDSSLSVVSAHSTLSTMSGMSVLSVITNTSDTTVIPYSRGQLEIVSPSSFSLNGTEFELGRDDSDELIFYNARNRRHHLVQLSSPHLLYLFDGLPREDDDEPDDVDDDGGEEEDGVLGADGAL